MPLRIVEASESFFILENYEYWRAEARTFKDGIEKLSPMLREVVTSTLRLCGVVKRDWTYQDRTELVYSICGLACIQLSTPRDSHEVSLTIAYSMLLPKYTQTRSPFRTPRPSNPLANEFAFRSSS